MPPNQMYSPARFLLIIPPEQVSIQKKLGIFNAAALNIENVATVSAVLIDFYSPS